MEGNLNLNILCRDRDKTLQERTKVENLNKEITKDMAKNKLTKEQLEMRYQEMYQLWMNTRITHKQLARLYGYSENYTRQIIHRMRRVHG